MVMLRLAAAVFAVGVVESVTITVKVVVPAAVGVPLIMPVLGSRLSPGGSRLSDIDHVYGAVPPLFVVS